MSAHRPILPEPISFLLIPNFASIAFFSALESLRIANRYVSDKFRWVLLSPDGAPCPDSNGITVAVQGGLRQVGESGSLIICANQAPERFASKALVTDLKRLASRRLHFGGIDTGAYLLAVAGLLDGYRVTVHWENVPAFRERFPEITLTNSLFEFDRDRFTCAGGTAVIDMMLHVIEARSGREVAVRVSEHVLYDRIRTGNECQRKAITQRFGVHHPKIVQAIHVMEGQLEEYFQTERLAAVVGVSPRQLLRLFKTHLNSSPAQLHLSMRLERARRLILQSDISIIDVAIACGFQSHSHFSRVYREKFGRSPRHERRQSARQAMVVMDLPSSSFSIETLGPAGAPIRPEPGPPGGRRRRFRIQARARSRPP